VVKELEECPKAIAVGGAVFRDKWGTPNVIGIREPKKSDIVKFPTEIVSAEVKIDLAARRRVAAVARNPARGPTPARPPRSTAGP
jgi:hypothetical protein